MVDSSAQNEIRRKNDLRCNGTPEKGIVSFCLLSYHATLRFVRECYSLEYYSMYQLFLVQSYVASPILHPAYPGSFDVFPL